MKHIFTPALDGATNTCPFARVSCHQTCCELEEESRSPCSHITHPLVPIELLTELSSHWSVFPASSPHPCSIFTRSEGERERETFHRSSERKSRCVCVATRPRRRQQTTKHTMSTGKNAAATEKWVVDSVLVFILKVVYECCAFSCSCCSACLKTFMLCGSVRL